MKEGPVDIHLREFAPRSALVTQEDIPQKARFMAIDVNNHFGRGKDWIAKIQMPYPSDGWTISDLPAGIALMDQMNIGRAINLDGGWGEVLRRNIEYYKEPYPNRFAIFAWVDWTQADEPNFGEKWAKELEKSVAAGASGLAVFKALGLEYRDRNQHLISADDPRFDPIWARAGELNIPVLIHTADPVAFFSPLDETNERWEELFDHPDWHFYGKDYPSFMELIERLLRVVERHPHTNFISAHVMGYAENLGFVARALDQYPNLYVDIAERISELGRQPYSARKFIIKYADRVLFGTDTFAPDRNKYQTYIRFLETEDEYFEYGRNQGRWNIYGINLPDKTLQTIYYSNAKRLIP